MQAADVIANFNGDYPSGAQEKFADAISFLSPEGSESSLEEMEECFRSLDSELVRQGCSSAAEAVIDELWRTIKLMYGGATRLDAISARQTKKAQRDKKRLRIYASVLKWLNPTSQESATLDDLKFAYEALVKYIEDPARQQVMRQLEKTIKGVEEGGMTVKDSVKNSWQDREEGAREKLG